MKKRFVRATLGVLIAVLISLMALPAVATLEFEPIEPPTPPCVFSPDEALPEKIGGD